jgi:hypothetical protein
MLGSHTLLLILHLKFQELFFLCRELQKNLLSGDLPDLRQAQYIREVYVLHVN